jgi:hypothetical protein
MFLFELHAYNFIPQNYVAVDSETCNVNQDGVNRENVSRKHNVEIGREVPDNIF